MQAKSKQKRDVYQEVTDTVIGLLEDNKELTYKQPWVNITGGKAKNSASQNVYKGLNQLLLSLTMSRREYRLNRWLTFKQVQSLGGSVAKGERATQITYFKHLYKWNGQKLTFDQYRNLSAQDKLNVEVKSMIRFYYVFNVMQTYGLDPQFYTKPVTRELSEIEKNDKAEQLLYNTGAEINHVAQDSAFYSPLDDQITLPERKQFDGQEEYYDIVFHELIHWTGHQSRLNRKQTQKLDQYAYEELIAELGGAFLCADHGFQSQITNNAAYLQSWLEALRNDKTFIFKASGQAQKAADFVHQCATAEVA